MADPSPKDVAIVLRDRFVEARYLGSYALDRYKMQMKQSVLACEENDADLMLVDIREMAGFSPSVHERFELGRYGAELCRKLSKVSILGTAEQIGPEPFGTLVARNRGLAIRAFTDREKAVEWLLG